MKRLPQETLSHYIGSVLGFASSLVFLSIFVFYALETFGLRPNFPLPNFRPYTIYSGDASGVYYEIAHLLDSNLYLHKSTTGSDENKRQVAENTRSFGFVQEDDLKHPNENIIPIASLYTEKLHVIYRKDANKGFEPRILSAEGDSALNRWLKHANICAGARNSSTDFMANQILRSVGMPNKKIDNDPLTIALAKLKDGKYQMLFYTAGFSDKFKAILNDTAHFGLASLDDKTVGFLDYRYNTESKTDFKESGYHHDYRGAHTIEVKAMLVCHKSVPIAARERLLAHVDQLKNKVPALNGQGFLQHYYGTKKLRQQPLIQWFSSLGAYFLLVILHLWAYRIMRSTYYQKVIFSDINEQVISQLPRNYNFKEESTNPYREPNIYDAQLPIINKIADGLKNGLILRNMMNEHYLKKHLINRHYDFLMKHNDTIITKLRQVLGLRLNYVLVRTDNPAKEPLFTKSLLRDYLTYTYITLSDYDWLIKTWEKTEFYRINGQYIEQLIEKGFFYETLDSLRILLDHLQNEENHEKLNPYKSEVIALLGRLAAAKNDWVQGRITQEIFTVERNKIRESIQRLSKKMIEAQILPRVKRQYLKRPNEPNE